ncbi:hypothetical protein OHA37_26885 [Streptomyces sp. NBC_00335]|uniref:hypothetical protein n=1 Tax=unclassified Streptomyces TaxID=2593676 RepID=UPI00225B41FB|nr:MULTISPECIES: hypothetical protein [unclassified Streptomyces]MCX5407476.1 hypothetical protein [Streptomyces sp. NBC_00086]
MTVVPLNTETEVRAFVALCLKTRTVSKLAKVMPDWLRGPVESHAPDLVELRETAEHAEAQATKARRDYTKALGAWISSEAGQ